MLVAALALPGSLGLLRLLGLLGQCLLRLLRLGVSLKVRDGTGDGVRVLVNVKALVDARGNGLDLGAEIAFNVVEVEAVVPVNEVDGQTKVAVAAGAANAVQVGLSVLGEVEVDDDINGLNVNATGEEVGADQVSADTVAEIVEDTVTGVLLHPSVAVEARVAEFGDFLGQ